MVSQKQLDANRLNAQKSTGPKTEEGKAVSSQNAIKHGLTGKFCPILPGEDEAEFNAFHTEMKLDLKPHGVLEREFVDEITRLTWRLRRVPKIEAAQVERFQYYIGDRGYAKNVREMESETLCCVGRDFINADVGFANVELYRSRLQRSLHAAIRELRKLRAERSEEKASAEDLGPRTESAQRGALDEESQRDTGLRPVQDNVCPEESVIADESSEHGPEAHVTMEPIEKAPGTNEPISTDNPLSIQKKHNPDSTEIARDGHP